MRKTIAGVIAVCAMAFAGHALAQEKLTVWWVKGFYKSEDDALFEAIKKYEAKSGVKVELSQYPIQDMIPKTVAALDAGSPPDVAYADVYDFQVTGKWAFDGKLADISDVLTPIKGRFLPNTIETTYLWDDKTKKRAYFAFPLKQQTMHIEYLARHAEPGGLQGKRHPDRLERLLVVLVRQGPAGVAQGHGPAHLRHRPADGRRLERLVLLVPDLHGRVQRQAGRRQRQAAGRRPEGPAGLVSAPDRLHPPYIKGCTPPSSTSWKDPDNNVAFHNKTTVMTHNATISIAAKWLDDANNETLTAEQRAAGKKAYYELIRTAGFPNKPDGSKMVYRAAVKTGVVFEAAKNKTRAKEFVAFLLQDENLTPYVEGSLGRWFPVTTAGHEELVLAGGPASPSVYNQFAAAP